MDKSTRYHRKVYDHRVPSLKSVHFWLMILSIALALRVLGLQIDQFWGGAPLWFRSISAFMVAGIVGEIFVFRYWPDLRLSSIDAWEISVGFFVIAGLVTAAIWALAEVAYVELAPSPLALTAYVSLLLLDASYRW